MSENQPSQRTLGFLKSLGFPELRLHSANTHFDFTQAGRRILVIGPMGSGKTEYSARVWRDSRIALKKSPVVAGLTTSGRADRRRVFFIRSMLDKGRFPDYPDDALAFRGGFERCGDHICLIENSFDLEKVLENNPDVGTWIIDEASFYDERIAYVIENASKRNNLNFIFPALILNFRKDIFNRTARLILETSTDIIPLTAYCEHQDCIENSFYTYRYYLSKGHECPALYFDPLIIIGGDREKDDPREPNYCTRCDAHHYLPGKEYTFLVLKPMGEQAGRGNLEPLKRELSLIQSDIEQSELYRDLYERHIDTGEPQPVNMNALDVPCIPEKILMYLYGEENLLGEDQLRLLVKELDLDRKYIQTGLAANRRPIDLDQYQLPFPAGAGKEVTNSKLGGA